MRCLRLIPLACYLALATAHAVDRPDPAMPPPTEHLSPGLRQAKNELQDIVARRDINALQARIRPDTKLDFGGSDGPEGFQLLWNSNTESRNRLWETLDTILALPGVLRDHDAGAEYCTPYVFCMDLPGEADPFDALVVLGTRVAIRARASVDGVVVRRVSHIVVTSTEQPGNHEPAAPGWTFVRLADGTAGYVSTRWVRSPIDFRLALRIDRSGSTWWIGFLLAGD